MLFGGFENKSKVKDLFGGFENKPKVSDSFIVIFVETT